MSSDDTPREVERRRADDSEAPTEEAVAGSSAGTPAEGSTDMPSTEAQRIARRVVLDAVAEDRASRGVGSAQETAQDRSARRRASGVLARPPSPVRMPPTEPEPPVAHDPIPAPDPDPAGREAAGVPVPAADPGPEPSVEPEPAADPEPVGFARLVARDLVAAALAEESARAAATSTPVPGADAEAALASGVESMSASVAVPGTRVEPQLRSEVDPAVPASEPGPDGPQLAGALPDVASDAGVHPTDPDVEPTADAPEPGPVLAEDAPGRQGAGGEPAMDGSGDGATTSDPEQGPAAASLPQVSGGQELSPASDSGQASDVTVASLDPAQRIARDLVAQVLAEEAARNVSARASEPGSATDAGRSGQPSASNPGVDVTAREELDVSQAPIDVEGAAVPLAGEGLPGTTAEGSSEPAAEEPVDELPSQADGGHTGPLAGINLLPEPAAQPAPASAPAPPSTEPDPAKADRTEPETTTPDPPDATMSLPMPEAGAADPTVPLPGLLHMPDEVAEPAVGSSSTETASQADRRRPAPEHGPTPAGPAVGGQGPVRRLTMVDRWRARRHRKRLVQEWAPGATPQPRRTWRWLLVTVILVVAFALFYALAVEAIRDLVAL